MLLLGYNIPQKFKSHEIDIIKIAASILSKNIYSAFLQTQEKERILEQAKRFEKYSAKLSELIKSIDEKSEEERFDYIIRAAIDILDG